MAAWWPRYSARSTTTWRISSLSNTCFCDLCNLAPHRAKYKSIFHVAPWKKRIPDSRERAAWYLAGKDAAPAAGIILRIAKQVEDACSTKLPNRSWGFVRVTKYTAAGTLTPR